MLSKQKRTFGIVGRDYLPHLEEIKRIYRENDISIGPGTLEFYLGSTSLFYKAHTI